MHAATWLVQPHGRDVVASMVAELDAGATELAVATRWRSRLTDPQLASTALTAAVARRRARARWPEADRLLFTRHGLEQASDPTVARWRARRLAASDDPAAIDGSSDGDDPVTVWDVTAGFGADAIAAARAGAEVVAVECDPARAIVLEHNLRVAEVVAEVVVGDALHVRVPPGARVHADPARRPGGARAHHLDDHEPPVSRLVERFSARSGLAITLAPGVDRDDPALGGEVEVEYLQLGEQLLEATVWDGPLRTPGVLASATLLPGGEHRVRTEAVRALAVAPPGDHLVEVVPAAVRARLHDEVGEELGGWRLARHRALLSVDGRPPDSPWYRARPVLAVLPAKPAPIRRWLADRDPPPIEIALHGITGDPSRWWRQLGRPPRGPQGWRLELIRRDDDAIALITDAGPSPGVGGG